MLKMIGNIIKAMIPTVAEVEYFDTAFMFAEEMKSFNACFAGKSEIYAS